MTAAPSEGAQVDGYMCGVRDARAIRARVTDHRQRVMKVESKTLTSHWRFPDVNHSGRQRSSPPLGRETSCRQ